VQYLYDHDLDPKEPNVKASRTIAAAVLAVSVAASTAAQAQTTLQYRWKQGDVVTYTTALKTDSTASGVPGAADVTFSQTMTQRVKLLAAAVAPDGTATLHETIEAVSVEMTTPMGTMAFDSAKKTPVGRDDASAALAKVFGSMVGITMSIVMSPNGAIQHIEGGQRALDKIVGDLPQDRSSAQMVQSLRSVLSEASMRASLEQSFPRLPLLPIKVGDTWKAQVELGNDAVGRITGTQTMTLKSADAAAAAIDVALTVKQESQPPIGPSGMTVRLGDGKGEGQIDFDLAAGRIRKATMRTEIPSSMTAAGRDGHPVTMKNVSKTSMTMEIVDK
jgi:hypothetical protein